MDFYAFELDAAEHLQKIQVGDVTVTAIKIAKTLRLQDASVGSQAWQLRTKNAVAAATIELHIVRARHHATGADLKTYTLPY